MRNKVSIGEYLAFLSTKYRIDPDEFFQTLLSAERNQEATCNELVFRCRGQNRDRTVILMLKGSKVVAQFPLSKGFLQNQKNPIKDFAKTRFACRGSAKSNSEPTLLHIKDLKNGMKQISLRAKVLEIPAPKLVYTRFGNYASVSNALITDDTGTIKLCLWNEQITSISIGDVIQIENARMATFRGESQLQIGRKGKLSNVALASPQLEEAHN